VSGLCPLIVYIYPGKASFILAKGLRRVVYPTAESVPLQRVIDCLIIAGCEPSFFILCSNILITFTFIPSQLTLGSKLC
jgi:hypothetical protein